MGTGSGHPHRILENIFCRPVPVPFFFTTFQESGTRSENAVLRLSFEFGVSDFDFFLLIVFGMRLNESRPHRGRHRGGWAAD
jgi:hypothetical protein